MVKYGKTRNQNRFHNIMEVSEMKKNLRVILTGEGSEFGKNCATILRSYGCDVSLVAKDGSVLLAKYESNGADVIVMDAFMSNLDALGVITELAKKEEKPLMMVMSSSDNQRFEQEVLLAGADYYFLKPFDINILAQRIKQLTGWSKDKSEISKSQNDTDLQVTIS